MKRRKLFNVLFSSILFAGTFMVSCNNDDITETPKSGSRTLSFNISAGFNEESNADSRALSEKPDTVYRGFNDGMRVDAVLERDKVEASRVAEQLAYNTKVLAVVINNSTNKVYRIQQLTVDINGKLTCEVPDYDVRIVFYSYNSISKLPETNLAEGDPVTIDSKDVLVEVGDDVLWATTGVIRPTDTNLGQIKFKHLFARLKVILYYPALTSFRIYLENASYKDAYVRIIPGTVTSGFSDEILQFENSSTGSAATTNLSSAYRYFIPLGVESVNKLSVSRINDREMLGLLDTNFTKKFEAGSSYTLTLHVTKNEIIWDWASAYTQWDAKSYYRWGFVPSSGSADYFNEATSLANYLCKNCPSIDDVRRMLASGIFWDNDGPEWEWRVDFPTPRKFKTGLWVKKKKYWVETGVDYVNSVPAATAEVRTSGQYMFLPASGRLTRASGGYEENVGTAGYYWTNTPVGNTGPESAGYNLYFISTRAQLETSERHYGFSRWSFWE